MTERLYYDDPYLVSFCANVVECSKCERGWALRLDRSAFYPTSGGQPYDTGTINDASVIDVYIEDGEVWHIVTEPIEAGTEVTCAINWKRRFDHMQQHAGEHMLANAVYRLLDGTTIGLHLGADISTIDVTLPDGRTRLDDDELIMLEDDVNFRIQRDVPINQWFPSAEEISKLPLRKAPTVDEHIRVVQIGDLEFCACGGTHPSSAGQIGLLKIIDARPSRGKLRLSFVCGERAYNMLRSEHSILHAAASALSVSVEDLPSIIAAMKTEQREIRAEIAALRKKELLSNVNDMLNNAKISAAGIKCIAAIVDADISAIRNLANELTGIGGVIALLGVRSGEKINYIAARSDDVKADMGKILSDAAKKSGGKGGGKPDFAQGGGSEDMLNAMLSIALLG